MRNINRIERTALFVFALLLILILSGIGYSGYVSRLTTWSSSQVLTAGALNAEFDNVLDNGVGVSTTQTLTNKTLTAPTISAPTITGGTITTPTINTPTEVFGTYSSSEINGTTIFDGNVSGTAIQDDDTFAIASNTKLATSESIKAYVDTQSGTPTTRYKSTAFSLLTSNVIKTFAHGLSGTPVKAWLAAECISTEHGYAVGDWAFDVLWNDAARESTPSVRVDSTNVYMPLGDSNIYVMNQAASAAANFILATKANWSVYLFAEFE